MTEDYPLSSVAVTDTAKELKCNLAGPILGYLRDRHGEDVMRKVVRDTQMNHTYLQHTSNWISFGYYCRLLHRMSEVANDPEAPFEACRYYNDQRTMNILGAFLGHLGSPGTCFRLVAQFHRLWESGLTNFTIEEQSPGSCIMHVRNRKYPQDKLNCQAIRGYLSSCPTFFNLPFGQVEELACACDGADACTYQLRWQVPRRHGLGRGVNWCCAVATLAIFALAGFNIWSGVLSVSVLIMGLTLSQALFVRSQLKESRVQNERQAASLLESMSNTERLNEKLQQTIEIRTQELEETNAHLQSAMSELKASQRQKIQQERQAAVGILAAGIAHEINSPLNGIGLSVQAFEESEIRDPALADLVTTARDGVRKCKRLVNQLLSFSREQPGEDLTDLPVAVRQAVRQFEADGAANRGVTVELKIAPDLPASPMETLQIEQIILNLLSNAAKAMGGQGGVNLELAAVDRGVRLTVADQGRGMPRDVARHIFDPFFKGPQSGGLGLGLSITRDLVQRNGGSITCLSDEGRGTTFQIEFPVPGGTAHA
jgi:signal transduction histidine kinase